jgi:hypothetical protein
MGTDEPHSILLPSIFKGRWLRTDHAEVARLCQHSKATVWQFVLLARTLLTFWHCPRRFGLVSGTCLIGLPVSVPVFLVRLGLRIAFRFLGAPLP